MRCPYLQLRMLKGFQITVVVRIPAEAIVLPVLIIENNRKSEILSEFSN